MNGLRNTVRIEKENQLTLVVTTGEAKSGKSK